VVGEQVADAAHRVARLQGDVVGDPPDGAYKRQQFGPGVRVLGRGRWRTTPAGRRTRGVVSPPGMRGDTPASVPLGADVGPAWSLGSSCGTWHAPAVTARLPEPPSSGVLLDAVLAERQARLDSIDAMTNKAGVLLGFTGTIVALTALLERWPLRLVVFVPAALAVRHSMAALKTVLLPGLSPAPLRQELLMQPPLGAQLEMLDYFTTRHEQLVLALEGKTDSVDAAGKWLAVTIGVFAGASVLDGVL
jgi:hypothetical protein